MGAEIPSIITELLYKADTGATTASVIVTVANTTNKMKLFSIVSAQASADIPNHPGYTLNVSQADVLHPLPPYSSVDLLFTSSVLQGFLNRVDVTSMSPRFDVSWIGVITQNADNNYTAPPDLVGLWRGDGMPYLINGLLYDRGQTLASAAPKYIDLVKVHLSGLSRNKDGPSVEYLFHRLSLAWDSYFALSATLGASSTPKSDAATFARYLWIALVYNACGAVVYNPIYAHQKAYQAIPVPSFLTEDWLKAIFGPVADLRQLTSGE